MSLMAIGMPWSGPRFWPALSSAVRRVACSRGPSRSATTQPGACGWLPPGTTLESTPPLLERGIRVVDLSADYRLRDVKVYEQWYKEPPLDAANLTKAVYGLPEVYGDAINVAKLIANPGCYPQ